MAPKSLFLLAALLFIAGGGGQMRCGAAAVTPSATVSGVVPCSAGNDINAAEVPPFPNAVLQAVCANKVVANTTAGVDGTFTMNLGPIDKDLVGPVLEPMLNNQCSLAVTTPLANCNASLADAKGTLTAPLQLQISATTDGLVSGLPIIGGLLAGLPIVGGLLAGTAKISAGPFSSEV
ncbi:unnamed protein product [Urochloa decumbens]|uniref:Uncharacterized protein n=1 Tax=Urochloa decumbens TaxID=240449 RepID=A0ABC9GVF2_9POAL